MDRQVFAYSGVLDPRPGEPGNLPLVEHALDLGRTRWLWDGAVRLCYLPTAVGDDPRAIDVYEQVFGDREDVEFSVLRLFPGPSVPDVRKHLLRQDVVLVEDGSLVNLLAVWRAHGMHEVLDRVLGGGHRPRRLGRGQPGLARGGRPARCRTSWSRCADGLGLLPFSNGVHHDSPRRLRAPYRRMVARGELPPGYATEDGVGLHFVGTELEEAVTVRAEGAGVAPAAQRPRRLHRDPGRDPAAWFRAPPPGPATSVRAWKTGSSSACPRRPGARRLGVLKAALGTPGERPERCARRATFRARTTPQRTLLLDFGSTPPRRRVCTCRFGTRGSRKTTSSAG